MYIEDGSHYFFEYFVQLANCHKLLKHTKKPYQYLVEGIQARDDQIGMLQKANTEREEQLKQLKNELKKLSNERNAMAADLERVLVHREVLHMYRYVGIYVYK